MKNKVFLLLTLSILVFSLHSHSDLPPGIILSKDVPREYAKPIEVHVGVNTMNIQYSPDGKLLAVVDFSGLYVFNTQTLKLVYQLENSYNFYDYRIVFSPDGHILATNGHGGNIHLWNADTGQHIRTLTGHRWYVNNVAFSPDGKILASGSADKTVGIWDVNTGSLLHTLTEHTKGITDVSFSPDGKTLASSGGDGLRLWDENTSSLLLPLTNNILTFVVFSPDGKTLASGNGFDTIYLWDVNIGSLLHRFMPNRINDLVLPTRDVFSPDGKRYASLIDNKLLVWDVNTGELLHSFDRSIIVAFSPNGKILVSGGKDGPIHLRDAETGSTIRTLIGHTHSVYSVAFSPDGRTLASGSRTLASGRRDGTVLLWDITPSQLPEDVNNDGVVNIQDLVIVANAFGEAEPDLNGDGVVNIQDLVIVASAFGNTVAP